MTGQRKECNVGRVQAGFVIKSDIKEQLQGSPCVTVLYGSDPLLVMGSRTSLPSLWNKGISELLGYRATWVILPPTLGCELLTLALCFSGPEEERSCSWLNSCVFLASVLVIKTAFVTACLGGFQGLLIPWG